MTNWKSKSFFGIFCVVAALAGCTSKKETVTERNTRKVNLAIWTNSISEDILKSFEAKTGIQVQVTNFSSNEELLGKLQAGATGYDVIVPTDYMVFVMSKLNLLKELERNKIPNFEKVDAQYMKKDYDKENKFSVPYAWGTTGIAVNKKLYKGDLKSWKQLFENQDLKGKFSLLDDARETLGAALKAQGKSLNSDAQVDIDKAKEMVLQARSRVKAFTSEPISLLVNGEVAVAHAYSCDALKAREQTNGQIEFFVPAEGGTFWLDNLAVFNKSQNTEEAYTLINFLLEPEFAAIRSQKTFSAPVIKNVLALLPAAFRETGGYLPSEKLLSKSEMIEDLGEKSQMWDRAWTEVKASR